MRTLALTAALLGAQSASPPPAPAWPDTPFARLAALATLQAFQLRLLTEPSATAVLDDWCAVHHLAQPGQRIVAQRVVGVDNALPPEMRAALNVPAGETLRYRHVRLMCGERVLSDADNWYVASRLTPDMNHELDTTDESFGRVVKPLNFNRRTLGARLLWSPLTEGWENAPPPAPGNGLLAIPDHVIENRALLSTGAGQPFSIVIERYTSAVLAFPPPPAPAG